MRQHHLLGVALLGLCLGLSACGGGDDAAANTDFVDASIPDSELSPLGWLGGRTHPVGRALEFEADGNAQAAGGLAVRGLDPDGPLAKAGVEVGDVLVRVGDDCVPVKRDPTLDLIRLVELAISGEQDSVELGCLRDGALTTLSLPLDSTALEVGLPVEVQRFERGAAAACEHLLALQSEDGGWSGSGDDLATSALAALALRACWAGEEQAPQGVRDALDAAHTRVATLSAADDASAFGLSLSTLLAAERLGRLPREVILAAGPRITSIGAMSGLPEGAVSGGSFSITLDDPSQLSELLEQFGGEGGATSITTFSGEGAPLELPEGAVIQRLPEGAVKQGLPEGFSGGGNPGLPTGEKPELSELLAQHDPSRVEGLAALGACVEKLCALQGEDGGWGTGDSEGDRILATAWALVAMGAAQRAGLELDSEVVEQGCKFLREAAHEGKVAAAVARGADRREEAGRAATVALAYHALGCADTEDFLRKLLEYSEERGRHVVEAREGVGLHLLALSVLRRMRGLSTWQSFFDEFAPTLVSQQLPDGSFAPWSGDAPCAIEQRIAGPVGDTALGAILLSMQSQRLETLVGTAENPFAPGLDGEGKRTDAPPPDIPELPEGLDGIPEGASVVTDPEEARKMLEQLGIDLDDLPEGAVIESAGDGG